MRYPLKICNGLNFAHICILGFFIISTAILPQLLYAQDVKTLDNGLRIIVKEDHRNPIVVFSVFIDVGSADEGEYMGSGISHLTEHMLFKGSAKYPPGTIENILHQYGGKIEGFTSYDYTGYRITILKKHRDVAVDILKEILTAPTFSVQELEKEMEVIEREMDLNRDDPGRLVSRLTFSNAYVRHPYKIPIIGYKENFKRLKRKDLVNFFKSNYTPERIVMAVVGDIEKGDIFKTIENAFGKIPRGKNRLSNLPKEPEQIAERFVEEQLDIEGAYLNIAFHSTALLDKTLYAMDLLSFVLGQGESSILNEELRIKMKLVLSISAYNYTPKDPGLFVVSGILKEENVKAAIDEILRVIDDIKKNGISEEDLLKAKNNFLAGYIYQKETIESQANDFAIAELLTGNPRFFESYIERIKSMTPHDIERAAKDYLRRENITVAIVSKSANTFRTEVESELQGEAREIKKIILKNKLPVLISKNPSIPIVAVSLVLKGGVRLEKEQDNGISKLASLMFIDGTNSMSRKAIIDSYESRGISLNVYSGNNSAGILARCLNEHTGETLRLISELSINSVFPEKELEREKKELMFIIDMQDNQIFSHGHRLLKKLLFKSHPYRFQDIGTRDSVDSINREALLSFHENVVSADNMVLGVSGDCDINEIEDLVKKYFSNIPLNRNNLLSPKKEAPIRDVRQQSVNVDKEQSLVLIGFHGPDIYSEDRYVVEVMVDILSSKSGILFKKIREKEGLSYATGAFHVLGIDPGYIALYALTSKENIGKVKKIIFDEITRFIRKGVSLEEVQKTKNHLKAMRQIEMQTNLSFIFAACLDELYGLGYDNYKNYEKNIDSVTGDDIKRVAKRFLTLNRCASLILEGK